jgi:putative ABC transport system permease protein
MFKNYLVVALRNLGRNRIFSLINVLGLSIGISASLVIFLIVQYHYSFDRFETKSNRMFRVVSDYAFQGEPGHTRGVPAPMGDAIRKDISGIENIVVFRYYNPHKLEVKQGASVKPEVFKGQNHIIFADAHYFDFLPYRWIAGNKQSAVGQAGRVVLSASRAKTYFPKLPFTDMLGKQIVYDDSLPAQVSGIVADLDDQGKTDFNFKEFISLPTILQNSSFRKNMYWDEWGSTTSDHQVWLQLSPGTSTASVEKRLKLIFDKTRGKDAKENNYTWAYALQPLHDIHFNDHYGNFDSPVAHKSTLLGLILVASFLILIACINFINLTTANAAQRAKEIGVRKTLGSSRGQLMFQFLGETFLVTLSATVLSVVLTPLILHLFSTFIPNDIQFSPGSFFVIVFLVGLLVSVTLLAGFYPAWMLSSASTLEVLKNRAYAGTNTTRRAWLRKSLTVSQFVIAQFFVIGALMVGKQIRFMLNTDLGFSKQAIISIDIPSSDTSLNHKKFVLSQLQNVTGVQGLTMANDKPSSNGWWTTRMEYNVGKKPVQTNVEIKAVDNHFLKLLQIPLLAGRDMAAGDTAREIIINETYLHELGFKQPVEAVGKTLKWDDKLVLIAGVFRDFHAHTLNFKINPMALVRDASQSRVMLASLPVDRSHWPAVIAAMKKTCLAAWPGEEFKYEFLDESVHNAYEDVRHTSQLINFATSLTIFICCLGLLGLVIYTTTHRTKEIGIRKVLGASVAQIMGLLSGDFVKLVALAFVIATPLAWWAVYTWLNDFVFRTSMSWWIFGVSGIGMIFLALLTLSVQTVRTAMANPVNSLRSE